MQIAPATQLLAQVELARKHLEASRAGSSAESLEQLAKAGGAPEFETRNFLLASQLRAQQGNALLAQKDLESALQCAPARISKELDPVLWKVLPEVSGYPWGPAAVREFLLKRALKTIVDWEHPLSVYVPGAPGHESFWEDSPVLRRRVRPGNSQRTPGLPDRETHAR